MDTFRKFDQLTTGCWLFNHTAFRLRAQKRLDAEILDGYAISVEGLYTKRSEGGRFNGTDVWDGKMATIAVDGKFIQGVFQEMRDNKVYFYSNTDFIPSMLTLTQIRFSTKEDLSPIDDLNGPPTKADKFLSYTFCVNTVFPELEMMAAKLVSD